MAEKKGAFYSQVKQIGALTAVPIILVLGPLLGFFAGDWIDRRFQTYPWGTISLLVLGFIAAGREIFRLIKQVLKEDSKKDRTD
jgi:F0F1-type ATP synthase assembly protein I